MIGLIAALALGAVLGAIFAAFHLPVPAPPSFVGVAGVFGVTLGWQLVEWLR